MKLETTFLISLVVQKHNLSQRQFSGISYSHFPVEFQADSALCMFLNVPFYFLKKKLLGKIQNENSGFFQCNLALRIITGSPVLPIQDV